MKVYVIKVVTGSETKVFGVYLSEAEVKVMLKKLRDVDVNCYMEIIDDFPF